MNSVMIAIVRILQELEGQSWTTGAETFTLLKQVLGPAHSITELVGLEKTPKICIFNRCLGDIDVTRATL